MSGIANDAGARAAEALLQASGVRVSLRMPAPASAGDETEQLGLAAPGFEDVPLGRGAFRKAEDTRVLLLAASTVAKACTACGSSAVDAMFAEAAGVVVGEQLRRVQAWDALRMDGNVYGYALTLAAPVR